MDNLLKILLIDDEPWALIYLKKLFDRPDMGFQVIASERNCFEALERLNAEPPDIVVTDIRMPDMTGIEFMQYIRRKEINCEVVIVSGFADFSYAQQAIHFGAFEYCLKPLDKEKAEDIMYRLRKRFTEKNLSANFTDNTSSYDQKELDHNFYKMLKYIDAHYSERLYLKNLSHQFYLNPNYCCSLFLKETGMTFSQYITRIRLDKAIDLLLNTHMTISKIAVLTGYTDSLYFNKVFKKQFGITPYQYRKDNSGQKSL